MYFLYTINGIRRMEDLTDAALADAGCGHLPAASTLITRGAMDGPDNAPCMLIADGRCPPSRLRYVPAEQTWTKSVSGKFWIGMWNADKPTEASLRRPVRIDGHAVTLDDGGAWMIPCARVFNENTAPSSRLPYVVIGEKDGVTFRMKSRFVAFSENAERMWEQLLTQAGLCEGRSMTFEQEYQLCLAALTINYHVGLDEINVLELLTTANMNQIGPAVVDFAAFRDFMENTVKKKCPMLNSDGSTGCGCGAVE